MFPEIALAAVSSFGGAGCLYFFWGRQLSKRLLALESQVARALPEALDKVDAQLDAQIALLEGDPDAVEHLNALKEARSSSTAGSADPAGRGERIPPPDPGIEWRDVNNRNAVLLAKQDIKLGRKRQTLTPRTAAMQWVQGTVFRDRYDQIFVVTDGRPVCIYQDGQHVSITALKPLADFDGGVLELLVTPAELRANHLIA